MNYNVLENSSVKPREIENLREAVGWDRSDGIYEQILRQHYAYYTARSEHGKLLGYVSVLSDGIADPFLLDLMVHPDHQKTGLGSQLAKAAIRDMRQAGVRCVQVTFNDDLEPFYARCGFHIFKGGIIDFEHMNWADDGE